MPPSLVISAFQNFYYENSSRKRCAIVSTLYDFIFGPLLSTVCTFCTQVPWMSRLWSFIPVQLGRMCSGVDLFKLLDRHLCVDLRGF
jgi:hypothetical protein